MGDDRGLRDEPAGIGGDDLRLAESSASPEECYQFGFKTIKEGWEAAV